MRLSIITFGSEGDTRPLAAVCRGLLDRGHDLKLFAERSTLSFPNALGVPCEALSGDIQTTLPIGDPRQEIRVADVMKSVAGIRALVAENAATWLRTVEEHARNSDAILFSGFGLGVALTLKEQLGKPALGLFFQPTTPTRAFPSPMMPPMKLPGWVNLLTYRLARSQWWKTCGESVWAARTEVYGVKRSPPPGFDFPALMGVSPELVPQPDDWPSTHRICGHWATTVPEWQPPGDLLDFLSAGEPPIYVGFGSPSSFVRAKALGALTQAIGGRRALFSPGWSRIDSEVLPKNFFVVGHVPHEWLFPRVSTVIHHGGAGTTHTAARAGVPQVVLPIGGDQYFWASRVAAKGAAPHYTRGARLNATALRKLLEFSRTEQARRCATNLSEAMSRENGVAEAIVGIERLRV